MTRRDARRARARSARLGAVAVLCGSSLACARCTPDAKPAPPPESAPAPVTAAPGKPEQPAPAAPAPAAPAPAAPAPAAPPPEGMVSIAGAEFFMGLAPGDHGMEPGSMVKVGSFFIDKLEVTAAQYAQCVASTQCNAPAARAPGCTTPRAELASHPVNCVDWYEADRYCRAQDKRLPTRAEWELAARGSDRRIYPWGNEEPGEQLCWQGRKGKDSARTCPVGTSPAGASPYGVLDMAGNVAEWTATDGGSAVGRSYATKGGGFALDPLEAPDFREVRSDLVAPQASSRREVTVGFRCAKDGAPAAVR